METTYASMEVDICKVHLELQWTKMATAWLETGEGNHCAFSIHKEVLFIEYQLAILLVELHLIKRAMYM